MDQIASIAKQLGLNKPACTENDWINCHISINTRCAERTWIEEYYRDHVHVRRSSFSSSSRNRNRNRNRNEHPFVGLSIGCNKGNDAIRIARMGTNNPKFDKDEWSKVSGMTEGVCNQRNASQFYLRPDVGIRKGEVHCIEPFPSTIDRLNHATAALGFYHDEFVVSMAALSSADGMTRFPRSSLTDSNSNTEDAGRENANIDHCFQPQMEEYCQDVPLYSLQSYADKFIKSKGPIHVLAIDVEGYDFDVLFGAGSVLDRTYYIEFEYHGKGAWKHYHISDVIMLLNGKGFTCYW
eukprot:CAMPEP_0184861296 /NCGR_PEP_ID=MMETSP0580-20130426/6009_1 /TAXON_ID=1118495 /ORGANISM="Dactyliosolen fragilissimus" /LENGTH=294 /DNA_ID=CAMNT_0027358725 /DNA_START=293 /DNA_END=1174 /DNA_ORIENTATION=-